MIETSIGSSMLETLDHTIHIGSISVLYFDLYLYSAYAAHYVYYYQLLQRIIISSCNVLLSALAIIIVL